MFKIYNTLQYLPLHVLYSIKNYEYMYSKIPVCVLLGGCLCTIQFLNLKIFTVARSQKFFDSLQIFLSCFAYNLLLALVKGFSIHILLLLFYSTFCETATERGTKLRKTIMH